MKNIVLAFCITGFIKPLSVFSQSYFYNNQYYDYDINWEAGVAAGSMNCLTDLGGRSGPGKKFIKDINWNHTQFCGGVYTGFLYRYVVGARLELTLGKVSASDNSLKNDNSVAKNRYQRNLHFQSAIAEISLTTEFHPLVLTRKDNIPLLSPYLLAGVGLFTFNPKAQLNGNWYSLQPLHTEGQGFAAFSDRHLYKLTQLNFPVGIGWKYEISALLNARIEIVHRLLLTDYLDDVSTTYINPALFSNYMDPATASLAEQLAYRTGELTNSSNNAPAAIPAGAKRGNPGNRDAYFTLNCKLGLVLNRSRK